MCCEVLGICRSIWNKFNFDCCERYRKPLAGYHHHGGSLPGVYNVMLSNVFLPYASCSAQS